jgi:hypothetical protein
MDGAARRGCWRDWATPAAKEEGERGEWVQEPAWAVFWRHGHRESGVLEKKTCGSGCSGWHMRREGQAGPIWTSGLGRAAPARLSGRGRGRPGGPRGKRARAGWAAAAAGSWATGGACWATRRSGPWRGGGEEGPAGWARLRGGLFPFLSYFFISSSFYFEFSSSF